MSDERQDPPEEGGTQPRRLRGRPRFRGQYVMPGSGKPPLTGKPADPPPGAGAVREQETPAAPPEPES